MSYDYYCHRCHHGYDIDDLEVETFQDYHNIGGGVYPFEWSEPVLSCPKCLGDLDPDGYVCDGCGAIMKDVYAYVDGEPICKSCADYILADDSHLVRCPECKRIIDRCLRPGKCILCQFDNIDAEIAAINAALYRD